MAQSIEQMVAFRLLQGVFGAALVPLSQAVMLDAYPPARRGSAMAIWGMGVMLGPIMGPTLGGWLTENYSWRWVFFINLPFGILTVLGLSAFMAESPTRRDVPFSWFGFLSLSLGIGALQMMLDRGQELGWFGSGEIVAEAILSVVGFYFFFVDSTTSKRPFIAMRIFRDWNFSVALIFMFLIGIILLATMALVTPFIQNLLGYPVLASGYLLGTRGVGTFFAMMLVGRLLGKYDARLLIFFGLVLSTASLWVMVGWSTDTSAYTIAINSVVQGVGLGFVFVPLNTVAFATLPGDLRTEGAAMWTLIRNIGSSVGISIVIAQLTNMVTTFHSQLVEHVTPFNDALHMPDAAHARRTIARRAGAARRHRHSAGGDHRLFQRLPADDLRLALSLPAARIDPLGQERAGPEPRRAFCRCGDGVSGAAVHRIMSASAWRIELLGTPNRPPYGTSRSWMTKIAELTETAHITITMMLSAFGGARRPKLANTIASQNTSTQ